MTTSVKPQRGRKAEYTAEIRVHPNAETQRAMEECRAGLGTPVPQSELKDWIQGKA